MAALMIAAVIGAGCDGGDESSPRATPSPAPTGAAASPSEPFEPGSDVLNVAITEPSTLDPMRLQDPGGVLVARQLYEGLTRWDPVQEKVVPAAAESWSASDGGRKFTFKLNPGMSFHDGTAVTSKDFKFAFERIALKRNASDLAYTLEEIEGFVKANQIGGTRHLAGIRTPGPLTLVIRLSRPYHDLPAVLTHPSLVPLPARAVKNLDTFLRTPVGNGPFHIAQAWSPGDPVLLKAFAGFIDTPEIDGIRFLTFPDAAASWLPFLDGRIDVAEVPAGEIEAAEREFGDQGSRPFLATYNYGLNVRSSLRNRKLRRAINRAIDRRTIVQTVYRDSMQEPRGIVPAGMPGFEENVCAGVCEFAPDAARRLVRRLPKKARRVSLEFSGAQPHPQVARLIKEDLRAVGLRVKIRSFPFGKYLKRLRAGDQEMYRLGWIAEYPVADAFLSSLYASESPDNHSGFDSERVDRLLNRAHATPSEEVRQQLYLDAEKAIMAAVPIAPIGTFVTHWAAQPYVQGLRFDQMGGFDAVGVSLAS
ncbi:MAG: peptide ABC transporter substrate-binding protein [Actinomycetota bacterium]